VTARAAGCQQEHVRDRQQEHPECDCRRQDTTPGGGVKLDSAKGLVDRGIGRPRGLQALPRVGDPDMDGGRRSPQPDDPETRGRLGPLGLQSTRGLRGIPGFRGIPGIRGLTGVRCVVGIRRLRAGVGHGRILAPRQVGAGRP
jgi:hypothetical protein